MEDGSSTRKKQKKREDSFEFCKVCKLNHNQGRKHIYFPNHKKALSTFLSRFQSKLSDVRLSMRNPTLLLPQHRIWCVFCDLDIHSDFACDKAIRHLASSEHLKNVKSLRWKCGGGMDSVDAYCISETDLTKWEKKCLSLKTVIAEEGPHQPLIEPMNDIHSERNSNYVTSNGSSKIDFNFCNTSNNVLPLQKSTNEKPQVSSQVISNTMGIGSESHKMQLDKDCQTKQWASGQIDNNQSSYFTAWNCSGPGQFTNGDVYPGDQFQSSESSSHGNLDLTRIVPMGIDSTKGNVHSGAPPPWFSGAESNKPLNFKPGKSAAIEPKSTSKLNPKRVGAAWAERRKIELEQERLGGADRKNVDTNWLPNFGGVWHSGSRKESRKQFEAKRNSLHNGESQSERALPLQPYVSKRMAVLRDILEKVLPDDVHIRSNGRVRVAVTQILWRPRGLLVDQFDSKEDLINAVFTSSFIPGYLAPRPATMFRNRLCIDGGLTLFMPPTSAEQTIRVCAFPASRLGLKGIGISPNCTPENRASPRELFNWALESAEDHVLDRLFELGYSDAAVWAKENPVEELVHDEKRSTYGGFTE